jgi:hypothetical protein
VRFDCTIVSASSACVTPTRKSIVCRRSPMAIWFSLSMRSDAPPMPNAYVVLRSSVE